MSLLQAIKGVFKFAQIITRRASSPSKSSKDKLKSKKFLEEDLKWTQLNDEEVISLISFDSEDMNNSIIMPTKSVKGRLCPLIFLGIFIVINIFPVVVNCSGDTQFLECIRNSTKNLSPIFEMIYQIGNLACTLLSVFTYCNIYGLQKASSNARTKWCNTYFAIGSFGSILWMAYIILGTMPNQGYYYNIMSGVILNLYFISSLVYHLFNQVKLKARIEDEREDVALKKLLLFFGKNIIYFTMLAIILIYAALLISKEILTFNSPHHLGLPVIAGYVEIVKIVAMSMSQLYISLYYVDINYIYEGRFSVRGSLSFDEKLNLNRL